MRLIVVEFYDYLRARFGCTQDADLSKQAIGECRLLTHVEMRQDSR